MKGTFRLVKICRNFGSAVNGKRFVGSSTGKSPEKVENLKGRPFSWLERSERNFGSHLHVSRTLYPLQLSPTRQPSWCSEKKSGHEILRFLFS